jgi:dolichol-phosphate hexosyltransferase
VEEEAVGVSMGDAPVTLLIPTRNEVESLGPVLEQARPFAAEIIVLDGHSTDGTRELAIRQGARVVLDSGEGKGAALRQGFREATHDLIVCMDGDGSHDPGDIPRLVAPLREGRADFVVASRLLGGSDEIHGNLENYVRMVGAGFITLVINLRWGVQLTDCENGYRAITRRCALALPLTAKDFTIEQQMVMRALKAGYRVTEVASHEYERQGGTSKLPTLQGFRFLWQLFLDLF